MNLSTHGPERNVARALKGIEVDMLAAYRRLDRVDLDALSISDRKEVLAIDAAIQGALRRLSALNKRHRA